MQKKLLILSPFAPLPLYGGAVVRIHHVVRELCQRYQVWWACRGPLPPGMPCRAVPNAPQRWLQICNPWYVLRLARLMRRERIDTLLISSIISGLHALLLRAIRPRMRLIYDAHNVEHLQMRRAGSALWPLMYVLEWLLCRRADEIWCVSATDQDEMARRLGISRFRMRLVPNGADTPSPCDGAEARRRLGVPHHQPLLFFGVLTYAPNARAVQLLAEQVMPRLHARGMQPAVLVAGIGGEALQARYPQIRFLGFVPELAPLLAAADAVVVPLESGSGTRLKILEALAAGTPVVTTAAGAEGLAGGACGEGLRVAADWDDFADQVVRCGGLARPLPLPAEFQWGSILAGVAP